jgi:quercetin dioxygenase-like cupin family protein
MKSTLKLDRRYDVGRLLADLATAERLGTAHLHFSTADHDGGWKAISLVSLGGKSDADSLRHGYGRYEKTPLLAHCPYFEEIIDGFGCPTQRVRLMRLEPGASIHEHTDPGDSWALGQVRLHLPIVTHEDVHFYLDGQRVQMRPGECWYCDFGRPHRVANRSPVARVHFVLDLTLNPVLRGLFPRESLPERLGNGAYWCRFHGKEALRQLARASGVDRLWHRRRKPTVGNQPA